MRAVIEAAAEKGYAEVTVADLLLISGVSRKTFYAQFRDKEECFLAAYDGIVDDMLAAGIEAYGGTRPWAERIRSSLRALLEFLAGDPAVARVAMVEVLAAGPRAFERYEKSLRMFIRFLEPGRAETRRRDQLPPSISEAIVGGIAQVLYLRVAAGEADQLTEHLDELLVFALIPYIGHDRAAKVAMAQDIARRAAS
jgi:AcrR family transcriptional regulator